MENNKLIALFMGVEEVIRPYYEDIWCDENGNYHEELLYYTSWDWLMPVVEKILCLGLEGKEWDSHYEKIHDALWGINIEAVYTAVIEFIKWYNLTKP